jgi:2'-hydroxyisoflavone reductase
VNLLVIGGTRFLGRAIVDAALGHGHQVTLFNRGRTNPDLYPGLRLIRADRNRDAGLLAAEPFDAAIDVAGMQPSEVEPIVVATRGSVGRYVFVSTISVYADHSVPQVEGQGVLLPREGQGPGEAYGAAKAASEQLVRDAFGERALVVRPGLIVGGHDPTDRFAYWPRRIAAGGRVLAPGGPDHPCQFIDVRDLGRFVVHAVERELAGTFNATGVPTTLGQLLESCQRVICGSVSELVWVPDEALIAAGVARWMGVPLWVTEPGWEAHAAASIERAMGAGLSFRPVEETISGTLAWDLARGGPPEGREGLSAEREAELLAALAS